MKFRIYVLLAGLILATPIILLNLSVFGTWGSFERTLSGTDETTVPGGLVDLGNSLNGLWSDHKEENQKAATFDAQALTKQRTITLTRTVTLDDVLAPGEARPKPEFEGLYILARAPAHSMRDCPQMLEQVAASCHVGHTKIKTSKAGVRTLISTYGYAPAYPMGDLSAIDSATVEVEPVTLSRGDRTQIYAATDSDTVRAAIYAEVLAACAKLRNRVGSCVVKSLDISEKPVPEDPDQIRVSASARLAWLKHDGLSADVIAGLNLDSTLPEIASVEPASNPGVFAKLLSMLDGINVGAPETPTTSSAEPPTVLRGGGAFRPAGEAVFQSVGGG